ncbi:MAG: hypothetical protein AAGU11_16210 [Syntrophobacteraceae bacterium]
MQTRVKLRISKSIDLTRKSRLYVVAIRLERRRRRKDGKGGFKR